MKIRDKERLCNDLIRICDQIGIIPDEIPHLVFDRKRYNEIRKDDGCSRNAVRDSSGECNISAKTIFVDGRKNEYQYVEYLTKLGQKRKGLIYRCKNVKATYRTYLHCMVHELVHYRFQSMQHGLKFEERTKEIIAGKRFEPKSITLGMPEKKEGLLWGLPGKTRLPKMTSEQRIETVKKLVEWLQEHYNPTREIILQELKSKLGKYVSEQEIETGMEGI